MNELLNLYRRRLELVKKTIQEAKEPINQTSMTRLLTRHGCYVVLIKELETMIKRRG